MYDTLGISLALAALLTLNLGASLVVTACWRLLKTATRSWSAGTRARLLFALRIGPPTASLIAVAVMLVPSYLIYEPPSTTEIVSKKLAAIALLSAAGVMLAAWRGLSAWFATRALLKEWLDASERIEIPGLNIPSYRLRHRFPVLAVVGSIRPRLFVANQVLDSLREEEILAALAHERGHLAARDNFKRVMIRACRDVLTIVPFGRAVDRAWVEDAEAAADEYAARNGGLAALNLASALIEIARMVPSGARPVMPAGAFILGDSGVGVPGRISRLIELASANGSERPHFPKPVLIALKVVSVILVPIVVMALINSHALVSLHNAMEHIVQLLS